jgi:homogentisate 1,2-dioxygenase
MTMNINTSPDAISRSSVNITPGYMSGFGNNFETEALPGAPTASTPSSSPARRSRRRAAATSARGSTASGLR